MRSKIQCDPGCLDTVLFYQSREECGPTNKTYRTEKKEDKYKNNKARKTESKDVME